MVVGGTGAAGCGCSATRWNRHPGVAGAVRAGSGPKRVRHNSRRQEPASSPAVMRPGDHVHGALVARDPRGHRRCARGRQSCPDESRRPAHIRTAGTKSPEPPHQLDFEQGARPCRTRTEARGVPNSGPTRRAATRREHRVGLPAVESLRARHPPPRELSTGFRRRRRQARRSFVSASERRCRSSGSTPSRSSASATRSRSANA